MTNPQHIEGLTPGQIEWMREYESGGMPEISRVGLSALERAGMVRIGKGRPPFVDLTPVARVLLATLDSLTATAVKEERERVLAEIDAAADRLRIFDVRDHGPDHMAFRWEILERVPVDEKTQGYYARTFTAAILAATPQNQSGSAG